MLKIWLSKLRKRLALFSESRRWKIGTTLRTKHLNAVCMINKGEKALSKKKASTESRLFVDDNENDYAPLSVKIKPGPKEAINPPPRKSKDNVSSDDETMDITADVIKTRSDRSTMNKLMAGVSLSQPTDEDPESMAQYGGPVPEGETDDIEANAIKDDPTPHFASGKRPGLIHKPERKTLPDFKALSWFSTVGDSTCPQTGMWIVERDLDANGGPEMTVIHLESILLARI
ncbi:hypothetical protein F5887DRAFT_921069 [Amanita rubescens]|nr:hypothetical protein F5887DRAFT_921069 [Amanita rubescens]